MENPLYDLIIGNVSGARDPQRPDEEWQPPARLKATNEVDEMTPTEKVATVETRSMKEKKERPLKPLLVVDTDGESVSREDIISAQQRDPTLAKLWKHVDKEEPRVTGEANLLR